MKNNIIKQTVSTLRVILISSLTIFTLYVAQAWVSPTDTPANGNVSGPITTSGGAQIKPGDFSVWRLFANSLDTVGKITSSSTVATDSGNTVVTKDYVDAAAGGGSTLPVVGGHYGSCMQEKNADFTLSSSHFMTWPMITCPGTGPDTQPTCAAGYTKFTIALVQQNTGSNGLYSDGVSKFDDQLDHYVATASCSKDLGADASTAYVRGGIYGSCYQEKDANFQLTLSKFMTYPMIACPGPGPDTQPTCAPGFTKMTMSLTQMNTGNHTLAMGIYSALDDQLDKYVSTSACVKD